MTISAEKYRDLYSVRVTAKIEGEIKGKMEIAQRLLNKGMSMEDVSDTTSFPEEQVKELIKA